MLDFQHNTKPLMYEKQEGDYLYQLTWQQYWTAKLFLKTRTGPVIATEWYLSLGFKERKKVKRVSLKPPEDDFYPDPEY